MRKKLAECMAAGVHTVGRAVLPIYRRTIMGRMEAIASCVLIRYRNTHFLVTAAHVIDEKESGDLYFPVQGTLRPIVGEGVMTKVPPGGRRRDKYDCAAVQLASHLVTLLGPARYIAEEELSPSTVNTIGHAYMALGYPISKNKDIDHVRGTVRPQKLAYACNVVQDNALARKLGVDGTAHLFVKYEKWCQTFDGNVFNSVSATGLSGGALIDLGSGEPLKPVKSPQHPFSLVGILIEVHHGPKRMIAVKIETVLRVLQLGSHGVQ